MPEKSNKKMVSKRVVLHFPKRMVDEPILYHLIKDFDLIFNILKASISPEAEGLMVVEFKGEQTIMIRVFNTCWKKGLKSSPSARMSPAMKNAAPPAAPASRSARWALLNMKKAQW